MSVLSSWAEIQAFTSPPLNLSRIVMTNLVASLAGSEAGTAAWAKAALAGSKASKAAITRSLRMEHPLAATPTQLEARGPEQAPSAAQCAHALRPSSGVPLLRNQPFLP